LQPPFPNAKGRCCYAMAKQRRMPSTRSHLQSEGPERKDVNVRLAPSNKACGAGRPEEEARLRALSFDATTPGYAAGAGAGASGSGMHRTSHASNDGKDGSVGRVLLELPGRHCFNPPTSATHLKLVAFGTISTDTTAVPVTVSAPPRYTRNRLGPSACAPPRLATFLVLHAHGVTPASHGKALYGIGGTVDR
jgi:hypothetical protein